MAFSLHRHTHTQTSYQCKIKKICFYSFPQSFKKILLQCAHLDMQYNLSKGKKSNLKTINIVLKPLIDIKIAGNNLQ